MTEIFHDCLSTVDGLLCVVAVTLPDPADKFHDNDTNVTMTACFTETLGDSGLHSYVNPETF